MSTTLEKATFPDLESAQCIALTTFYKTGQAVTTPVWFAISGGTIYVETHANTGKIKRLRHAEHVTLVPCRYSGKVTGLVHEGNARILMKPEECMTASVTVAKKYGIMRSLFHFASNASRVLQRKASV